MAALSFAFGPTARTALSFHFPFVSSLARLRGGRYAVEIPIPWSGVGIRRGGRWSAPSIAPSWSRVGTQRGPRYRALPVPFMGEIPPANVRANATAGRWQGAAEPRVGAQRTAWAEAADQRQESRPVWREADGRAATWRLVESATPTGTQAIRGPFRDAGILAQDGGASARDATEATTASRGVWGDSQTATRETEGVWFLSILRQRDLSGPFQRASATRAQTQTQAMADARTAVSRLVDRFPWDEARALAGLSWPWVPLPPLPPIPNRRPLRFHFHPPVDMPLAFHFGAEPAWVIPIRRSYRMIHTIALVRLPDRVSIPVTAMTLSSAWDEWGWSVSATLAGEAALALVRPIVSQALEVEATVDGNVWQFRLDQVSGSVQFGQSGGQIQGRSRAALLGPDVALPVNGYETDAKTAQQLATQELTGTDWQLDWSEDLPDWLVPAGRYSYSQKTPLDVIVQLVETAGGRVIADPALSWLRAMPRYPAPVWEWTETEPDVILPRSILITLGWKPRIGQPWDAVYLGDGIGILAKVQRAGLPGTAMPDAPTIDPLLCHLDACRGRGIAILSDAAAGVDFTLALPLSTDVGLSPLRDVGELVRFVEGGKTWAGLITDLTVSVGFGTVVQTLGIRAVEVPA
jgi:hypothetical protein